MAKTTVKNPPAAIRNRLKDLFMILFDFPDPVAEIVRPVIFIFSPVFSSRCDSGSAGSLFFSLTASVSCPLSRMPPLIIRKSPTGHNPARNNAAIISQ